MGTPFAVSFETTFKITNVSMIFNGSHPFTKRNLKWMAHYAAGMTLTWFLNTIVLYSSLHSVKMGDISEVCRHGTLGIVAFIISFKYAILLLHQEDARCMLRSIERDYVRAQNLSRAERRVVRHYAERGASVTRLWFAVAVGTSSLFPLRAMFLMLYYAAGGNFRKVMVFDLVLPIYDEQKYDLPVYLFLTFMTAGYAYYAASVYMAFDPFVPILLLHCCGQLELAKMQIDQLFSEDSTHNLATTKSQLKCIIEHLQNIYSFLDILRRDFAIVYEMILKATTVLIPIVLFQIIESIKVKAPSLEFISFWFGCLVHFYVPCYYSDLLMNKSVSVAEAVYSCGWERQGDPTVRRTLAFMIARAHKPLAMTTTFQTMCLDSFTEMCRQSYTIFNVMNAYAN